VHVSDAEVRATTASRNTQLIIPSTSGQLTFLLVGHILLFGLAAASLSAQGSLHNVSHFSNRCYSLLSARVAPPYSSILPSACRCTSWYANFGFTSFITYLV